MVSPRERDALARAQKAVQDKISTSGIVDAAKRSSNESSADAGTGLDFDGVDISITGVSTQVTKVSDDVALVKVPQGQIDVKIDPKATKGLIRAFVDHSGNYNPTESKTDLSKIGNLTLVAVRNDGRWFISGTMTLLDAINSNLGLPRGTIPTTLPEGANSPHEAATNAVNSAQSLNPAQLAANLVDDEARAGYLYSHILDKADKTYFHAAVTAAEFTDGQQDASRGQAVVSRLEGTIWNGARFSLNDRCASGTNYNQCLQPSAFLQQYYGALDPLSYFAKDGKFALTTVNEHGKWKVSLLDSIADHVVSIASGLSNDQALRLANLMQGQNAQGSVQLDQATDVKFNDAGFAVRTFKVDRRSVISNASEGGTGASTRFYAKDGKTEYGQGTAVLDAGEYVAVFTALKPGQVTATVKLAHPVNEGVFTSCGCSQGSLSADSPVGVEAVGPGGADLTITQSASFDSRAYYSVLVDGHRNNLGYGSTKIHLDPGAHQVKLDVQETTLYGYSSSRSSYAYASASFDR
ncbi:hypothetical protein [Sinomonas gamaensis]|uniref:hypothetical protein n=1 Tax=Sinomonas gamaensis TaxID=2565624 RepID=UPI001109F34E|nr:hypothetical protein [Sinomonas gamaensis]